jgi:hypothetical protein
MITVNAITISSPTRFQVSFTLTPPYTEERQVAGDGKWSVVCGTTSQHSLGDPNDHATIYTEGAHNIAPHEGEPVPNIVWFFGQDYVTMDAPATDPTFGANTVMADWAPKAHGGAGHVDKLWVLYTKIGVKSWRVEVNVAHGTEAETVDLPYEPRRGCLFPWWMWPLPLAWHGRRESRRHGLVTGTRWEGK